MILPHAMRLLVACACFSTVADSLASETAEDVARKYMDTIQSEGVAASVRYMHPEETARFKAMVVPLFDAAESPGASEMAQAFFGEGASAKSVASMPAADVMRAFLRILDGQFGEASVSFDDLEVLGRVSEDEVVHLVARVTTRMAGFAVTKLQVISLKPVGDSWGLMLTGEMEGFAQAIRARRPKPVKEN